MTREGAEGLFGQERPRAIRPGRAQVRTTFQFVAEITGNPDEPPEAVCDRTRRIVLDWVQGKLPDGLRIPAEAAGGSRFDLDHYGQKVQAVTVPEGGPWALRLEQPDAPLSHTEAVPGRSWITDCSLATRDGHVQCALRVQCASLPYATEPIHLVRPLVIAQLAEHLRLHNEVPMGLEPVRVGDTLDAAAFEAFLENERRHLPVILLVLSDMAHAGWINPDRLTERALGFAHVVTMDEEEGLRWTRRVGEAWSAGPGTIRVYYPRLRFNRDAPANHPTAGRPRIASAKYEDERGTHSGPEAFERALVDELRIVNASGPLDWRGAIFYAEAYSRAAAHERQYAKSDKDHIAALTREKAAKEAHIEELNRQLEEAFVNWALADEELKTVQSENYALQSRVIALEHALANNHTDAPRPKPPTTYEQIPAWVEEQFKGRLVLHTRAVRALKDACYTDIARVTAALELLATDWRDQQMGIEGAKARFDHRRQQLELSMGQAIAKERAGSEGDHYFVEYPPGRRQFLRWHLRKGKGEPQNLLAIYFFWEPTTNEVVVGHLPSHLPNRLT